MVLDILSCILIDIVFVIWPENITPQKQTILYNKLLSSTSKWYQPNYNWNSLDANAVTRELSKPRDIHWQPQELTRSSIGTTKKASSHRHSKDIDIAILPLEALTLSTVCLGAGCPCPKWCVREETALMTGCLWLRLLQNKEAVLTVSNIFWMNKTKDKKKDKIKHRTETNTWTLAHIIITWRMRFA